MLAPGVVLAPPQKPGGPWIELATTYNPPAWRDRVDQPLAPDQLASFGLALGQVWWVLPAEGPPVRATLAEAHPRVLLSNCDGAWGIEARLEADLPAGTEVVAFARGEPPAGWRVAPPAADATARSTVEAAAREALAAMGLGHPELTVAGRGETWWVSATQVLQRNREQMEEVRGVVLVHDASGLRTVHDWTGWSYSDPQPLLAVRDVDGDGRLDSIWGDSCSRYALNPAGEAFAGTQSRCCGC